MPTPFTLAAIEIIRDIPEGRVLTYGRVAALAGNPGGARQVSRLLHSMSKKYDLPWHRVINSKGRISLPLFKGHELQKALLESEGVRFGSNGALDLNLYMWKKTNFGLLPGEGFF